MTDKLLANLSDDLPLSRRDFLRLSALLTGSLALPQLARAANPNDPVRIGYLPITDASPLLVAHSKKLFEAQGLEVEAPKLFRSWAQIVEAFMAGQVNVVHLLSPMTVWARYGSNFPAKVVAWNHMSGSALTVAPTIQNVKDLGGKKVAVPFWYSVHNVVLQHLLRENGLTVVTKPADSLKANEVALSIMAPADMGPALANGAIAGFIVAEPFNAAAETNGIGRVLRFTGDVWREHACCVVTMHERDLKDRPEWSQKVVNGIVNAQHWLRDNRKEGAQLLSKDGAGKYTPFPPAVLERVLVPNTERNQQYVKEGAIRPGMEGRAYRIPTVSVPVLHRATGQAAQGDAGRRRQQVPGQPRSGLCRQGSGRRPLRQEVDRRARRPESLRSAGEIHPFRNHRCLT
jgi:NitT/TauT family transport system substrate-binding protein